MAWSSPDGTEDTLATAYQGYGMADLTGQESPVSPQVNQDTETC